MITVPDTKTTKKITSKSTIAVAPWQWWIPLVLFVMGAPLWLHRAEPEVFLAINIACKGIPAVVWAGLSLLGNAWGVLGITAPLLILAPRLMMAWLCAAPFAIAFARIGKSLIESPRPAAVVDNVQFRIVGETLHNVSMPSGHTTTAFAVASAIYFALPKEKRARHLWLFGLAGLVGISRIAVGAHWPGDVVVGASLGLLAGMLGQLLLNRIPAHQLQPQAWSQRLIAIVLVATFATLVSDTLDFDENYPLQYALAAVVLLTLVGFGRLFILRLLIQRHHLR